MSGVLAPMDRRTTHGLPVHLICHVPKCAGHTIDRHLERLLPPGAYHGTKKRRGIRRFLSTRQDIEAMPDPTRIRAVCGHFLGISIESSFAGRALKRSILLRDPVSHAVSYYNFRMMRYLSEGLNPYSFKLAYAATQRNFVTHYILRNFLELPWSRLASLSDDEKYEIVNAFLATFWFVGDYRLCDELVAALAGELGISRQAPKRNTRAEWERRVNWRPLEMGELPAGVIMRIRRENPIDQMLWEGWREARHDTASTRLSKLGRRSASSFIATEAMRLVSQIVRRIERRRRGFEVPQAPVAQDLGLHV